MQSVKDRLLIFFTVLDLKVWTLAKITNSALYGKLEIQIG